MLKRVIPILLIILLCVSSVSAVWYNQSYNKKIQVNVTGWSCLASYCQFPVNLTLNLSNTNGKDIIVVNSSEDGTLPFWREMSFAAGKQWVWVNASSGTTQFYVYYNSSTPFADRSSGYKTFIVFAQNCTDLAISPWTIVRSSVSCAGNTITSGTTGSFAPTGYVSTNSVMNSTFYMGYNITASTATASFGNMLLNSYSNSTTNTFQIGAYSDNINAKNRTVFVYQNGSGATGAQWVNYTWVSKREYLSVVRFASNISTANISIYNNTDKSYLTSSNGTFTLNGNLTYPAVVSAANTQTWNFTFIAATPYSTTVFPTRTISPEFTGPCSYKGSGNWILQVSDNCTIINNYVMNANLTFNGSTSTNSTTLRANLTNVSFVNTQNCNTLPCVTIISLVGSLKK